MYKTVNYHFTRVCNYTCEFCFFTQKNSHRLSLEQSLAGIQVLRDFGIEKINFAGGEPFLYPTMLGEMIKFSKEIGFATSVITNGSLVTAEWFDTYGPYLDMFGISCDSLDEEINKKIGRYPVGKRNYLSQKELVQQCFRWARKYGCITKMNTVVCKENYTEDFNAFIQACQPDRWKVFQVLYIANENGALNTESKKARNAQNLLISTEAFHSFVQRHPQQALVAEEDEVINNSYLMVDEYMRFIYSNEDGQKITTASLLEQPIDTLLPHVNYSAEHFTKRKGEFNWFKEEMIT